MATNGADHRVDVYLAKAGRWPAELRALRAILSDSPLTETFKWRQPCYTFENGNVAILWNMKESCGLSFFKGVLLDDPEGVLVAPGENSRSARVFKATSVSEIDDRRSVLEGFIRQAMEIEKAGRKVDLPKNDLDYPQELTDRLGADPELKAAFESLTPGRRRGYVLHFSQAKQSATRASRIEKRRERILAGKGMHDR